MEDGDADREEEEDSGDGENDESASCGVEVLVQETIDGEGGKREELEGEEELTDVTLWRRRMRAGRGS